MVRSGARVVEDALAPHGNGRREAHLMRAVSALFAHPENSGAVRRPTGRLPRCRPDPSAPIVWREL
jgi:hypothetical protein